MELSYFINLIFIFAVNVLFLFTGICLNSLVLISFWRSGQVRKKLCYFMIMILSCCDLLAVLINHPLMALFAVFALTEKFDANPSWAYIVSKLSIIFLALPFLALLVMNFDRYLATYYPLFHRTSVTKRRLLTLFATLSIVQATLLLMSINNSVITHPVEVLVCLIITSPPMLFINYKLFKITRKSRRNNGISPEMKKTFSWKNISSCLLAVVCFVVLSIPAFLYSGLGIASKNKDASLNKAFIVALWSKTIASMNSTCNCLIFYWKNKILQTEGMKVIKSVTLRRNAQS